MFARELVRLHHCSPSPFHIFKTNSFPFRLSFSASNSKLPLFSRNFYSRSASPTSNKLQVKVTNPFTTHSTVNYKSIVIDSIRFNSSKSNQNTTTTANSEENRNETTKKKTSFSEVIELLSLTKSELPTFTIAIVCLFISSTVSMLFPSIIGKVIDEIKDSEIDTSDPDSKAKLPSTISIFNYNVTLFQFYSTVGVIFLIGSMANFSRVVLLRKVGEKIMAKLRLNILKKIFYQDSKFWDIHKSGDLISRLVNDSTVVTRSITQNLSDGLRSTISGVVGVSMMLMISVKLTSYMILMFPFLILVAIVFGRRIKFISKDIQKQLGQLTKISEEQFGFIKTIQNFNNEIYEVNKFKVEVKKLYDLSVLEGKLNGVFFASNGFMGNIFLILLLSTGSYMVRQGELTIGELSSYLLYTTFSASSIYSLSNFYSELMKGLGASERVFELIKLKPSILPTKGLKDISLDGDIEFKNIKFNYPTRPDHKIFQDLNLKINKGDHICLVGPSGCGKSTIVQLLLRYYQPNSGDVLINGYKLDEINLHYFRQQIGIVQQEPMLFSGSLRENIIYGNQSATEDEILKVSKLSNSLKFIDAFPNKFDTIIGSKGAQLSGGQKQRIALARTLLLSSNIKIPQDEPTKYPDILNEKNELLLGPNVLLLDEATSALDSKSEEAINKTLQLRNQFKLTTISIAHRLSTIKMSDKIVVFNNHGEIIEVGEFDTLIDNKSSELNKLLSKSEHGDDAEESLTLKELQEQEEEEADRK